MNPLDNPIQEAGTFKLSIKYQESYSRGELLLRSFFGFIYIAIPHIFVLLFIMIGSAVLNFIAFWAVLFTGQHPRGMFDYQVNAMRWQLRLNAVMLNLADGYPAFGMSAKSDNITLEVPYPERLSIGLHILKFLFGFIYVYIPHIVCLLFRMIAMYFVIFIAWWAVLFTGKYPAGMHAFAVGTIRWQLRINLYMMWMSDVYPPFSGE